MFHMAEIGRSASMSRFLTDEYNFELYVYSLKIYIFNLMCTHILTISIQFMRNYTLRIDDKLAC